MVTDEPLDYLGMLETDDEALEHIGIKRRSGRFPWGSGETPFQRSKDFKSYLEDMKSKGLTEAQIAEGIGAHLVKQGLPNTFKTPQLRAAIALSTEEIRDENVARATHLRNTTGMSNIAIAKEMGTNESTVRGWLKRNEDLKTDSIRATANALKAQAENKPFLDVGKGTHLHMGVSATKLNTALALLAEEGYTVHSNIKLPQLGTDKLTTFKILTKEDVSWSDTRLAVKAGQHRTVAAQTDDNGLTFRTPKALPESLSSKRVEVAWAEDGGTKKDGVIELRRGVEDLSLGGNRYAQVRVAVDGSHYLKGMAMYADDLPAGIDVRFNTNKSKHGAEAQADGKLGAMKPLKMANGKVDPDNPFGASIDHVKTYVDAKGKEHSSPLNIVNEEGKWDDWSRSLSSQMLSKQSVPLASAQLAKARIAKETELKEINALTNPVVKRKLLQEYADGADAAAVHLKAAALPRQSTHVILPINSIKPHEIYAPNFTNGEKVVLVRHPHGGPFEIPELTVNNNNRQAQRLIKGAKDAVGIHHTVAEQLSGADFDGDTVLVIPNTSRAVKTRPPLAELKGFEPKIEYKETPGMTYMTKKNTQTEMGKISNLITDMTIRGADHAEIARAVKHSMVVIDAEKHKLNYKQSEKDNNISQLKAKYQDGSRKGAATIISRASSNTTVPQQKRLSGAKGIDPKTGEKVFEVTGNTYPKTVTKTSKRTGITTTTTTMEPKVTKGTKMEFAKDARELLSNNPGPMEHAYAEHANAMKQLANQARLSDLSLVMPKQSPAAKALYANEVKSLDAKLKVAQSNAPLERRAQAIGGAMAKAKIDANPGWDKDDIKKAKYQALEDARITTGASKKKLGTEETPITPREWEAIQSRAVSSSKLKEILDNADMARIKELATPRARTALTPGQLSRAKSMASQGRSTSEIAEQLGLPRSTVADNLKNA